MTIQNQHTNDQHTNDQHTNDQHTNDQHTNDQYTNDQYTHTVRQTQETWADAIESFTKDLQHAIGQQVTPYGFVDPNAVIDQVFDFWGKTLEVQRDFAKKLTSVTVAVGESVRAQAESTNKAVRGTAARTYEELIKAELQGELARRDLPKTGNVDELRQRLIEDDQR